MNQKKYQRSIGVHSSHPRGSNSDARGFSLVEIIIATFIFALLALGLTYSVLQSRRVAENLVFDNISLSMAQGYLEQIRSLGYSNQGYSTLLDATVTGAQINLEMTSVQVVDGDLQERVDLLTTSVDNTREVPVDIGEDGSSRKSMTLTFHPNVRAVTSVGGGGGAIMITLSYSYEVDSARGMRTKDNELRALIAGLE